MVKTVKNWTRDSMECLRASFDCTVWDMFYECHGSDVNELTDVVSSYIAFNVEKEIPTKEIRVFSNNKPWVTKDLKQVLNKKKRVFFEGTAEGKKQVNKEVKSAIRKAKETYKNKIESKFVGGNFRAAWQGIKNMAAVNNVSDRSGRVSLSGVSDEDLPDVLNSHFTRFERHDFSSELLQLKQSLVSDKSVIIDEDRVEKCLKKTNVRKAPGPDGICGRTLKCCSQQLSGVFRHLFQTSVDTGIVPSAWKHSTVIPIPKKSNPKQPNDFRPVALTSLVMKTFERIVRSFILSVVEPCLDPLQFAYRAGKGVEDAQIFILEKLYSHLETQNAHARLLFADFSSAFNLMQPHILLHKLTSSFNLAPQLVLWIADFLSNRSQHVFVNGHFSNLMITNTGSPQGCCLSPLLYILYTDDCRSSHERRFLVKFADDSALLSLLYGAEHDHGPALSDFVSWCDSSYLELNVKKTQEMVIDFRRQQSSPGNTVIHGEEVEVVTTYKYLGTIIDNKLTWNDNTEAIVKKCQQRMFFLRKLNSFGVDKTILTLFYSSFIESVLTFSFICWYFNLSVKNRNNLQKIVSLCSKVIGEQQRDLTLFCERQTLRKAHSILADCEHVLYPEFELLPSRRRFRCPAFKTIRRRHSFVPTAVRILNDL